MTNTVSNVARICLKQQGAGPVLMCGDQGCDKRKALKHAIVSLMSVLGVVCLLGCDRAPSKFEYVRKSVGFATRYVGSNALSAEGAMLEWERYARRCQKEGTKGVSFDMDLAAIYSRLYLVEKHLGRDEMAAQHYREAADLW